MLVPKFLYAVLGFYSQSLQVKLWYLLIILNYRGMFGHL